MGDRMKQPQQILQVLGRYKYLIVIVLGVLIVGFVDENSFYQRYKHRSEISSLKQEIKKYSDIYTNDTAKLNQLDRNPKAVEKIARERYFMKSDDEDIFVLDSTLSTEQ
jgi:cell division protein DivIC